jgi:hypothetical protein
MNVRANKVLGITYIVDNNIKGDIANILLSTYREALKRNIDKKFINLIYPRSDILIPGE